MQPIVAADPWIEKVSRACAYLAGGEGHVSLATLTRRLGGSPYHFQRNFKRIVGVSPREYAEACRLQRVRRRLREGDAVTAAVFDAGYGSSSRFYERAVPKLGMSPSAYRRGGAGLHVRYTIVDSTLGRLLVAGTDKGICSVAMSSIGSDARARAGRRVPRGSDRTRRRRAGEVGEGDRRADVRAHASRRLADRRPGNRVSVAGVESADRDSARRDAHVLTSGKGHRSATGGARGGARLRDEPGGGGDPVSSRRAVDGRSGAVPVGAATKEEAARARAELLASATARHEATKVTKHTKLGHSLRKATRGSTRLARRAGTYAASNVTTVKSRQTAPTTGTS